MNYLYAKNVRPLKRRGDDLFTSSGTYIGRIREEKVFDSTGRYTGYSVGRKGSPISSLHRFCSFDARLDDRAFCDLSVC